MKSIAKILLIVLILIFAFLGFNYVMYRTHNAVSDAAFVKTDSLVWLSFKVGGKVEKLTKLEGDSVKKEELLAKLDTKDFLLAKQKLQHQIDALAKKIEAKEIQKRKIEQELNLKAKSIAIQKQKLILKIKAFTSQIAALKAQLLQQKRDTARVQKLYAKKLVQKEKLEVAKTKLAILQNQLDAKEAMLSELQEGLKDIEIERKLLHNSKKEVALLEKVIAAMQEQQKALQKSLEEMENKITYSYLKAPFDGVVAKRFVNRYRVVDKGTPIYALVNPKDLHIEVLLSERKLKGVKVGNEVKITIDAFKDREYRGRVSKILPASAATFSLVPRDIASGEFTKLDQRFIVRISIENPTPDLRVGMGASVAIARK